MSLWGEKEQGERRLSIISTKEQTEGKHEAEPRAKVKKKKGKNKVCFHTTKEETRSCN